MATRTAHKGEFTGKHMLIIMLAFFGVIIGVNVTMAVFAGKSWSGLVVKNSYVASQHFNEKLATARQQAALGWQPQLALADGKLSYRITDSAGQPVRLERVTVKFERPVSTANDIEFELAPAGNCSLEAGATLADGIWVVEIYSEAGLEQPYRDVRRVVLSGGEIR